MKSAKNIFLSLLIVGICFSGAQAWTGLIAQNGDILNVLKWNELVNLVNTKLNTTNIIAGTNVTVSTSGNDVTINAAASSINVAPYVSNGPQTIPPGTTKDITIRGTYFSPGTVFSIPGFSGTINTQTAISPTEFTLNITAPGTEGNYNLVASNGGTLNTSWPGNGINFISISSISGNGPAGTYTETFESGLGNWVNGGGNVAWTRDSGGTPSNNTGPTSGAGGSTWYIFTEASNPNFPSKTFIIETDNFAVAQNISFDYHMFGAAMGTLELQTQNAGVWETRFTISGQQQTTQGAAYLNQSVNLSAFPVEKIRFFYTSGTDYTGDVALDNITITSN